MRKILILIFTLASLASYAQPQSNGEVRGRTKTGQLKSVGIDSLSSNRYALSTTDSLLRVLTGQHKTIDSVSQNILTQIYELWRNSLSSPTDNKVGTRDTTLQQVLSSGKLKVQDDSSFSRSTVKISAMPTVTATVDSTTASRRGVILLTNPTITNTSFGISGTLPSFASTPTVNVGTGAYAVLASDSTKYRKVVSVDNQLDSTSGSRRGVVLLTNPTITNDSSTMSRSTVKISSMPTVTANVDSTSASRRGVVLIQNPTIANTSFGISGTLPAFASTPTVNVGTGGYSVLASDSTKYRKMLSIDNQRDSLTASRKGVVLLTNPTVTNDSSSMSRTTVKISNLPAIQNVYDTTTTNVGWALNPPYTGKLLMGYDYANPGFSVPYVQMGSGLTVIGGVTETGEVFPMRFRDLDTAHHVYITDSIKVYTTGGFGGGGGGGGGGGAAAATTIYDSTITRTTMTVTNLNSLANSATVGWGSDSVTNYRKASDYRINVTLTMANTAPANDRAAYVYIVPLYNNNGTFETSMQGTTTAPSLAQGASTIATPNNLRLLGVLSYTTQNMILRDTWSLSEIFPVMPDGFKIIIINFTGAATAASGNQVNYTPIFKTQR